MKKRNDHHHHQQTVSQKVAPISEKEKDRKMSFHQLNVNRAQHFRDRALVAEREARYVPLFLSLCLSHSPPLFNSGQKSDPNHRRSSFQAVFF
jgi:hypothetical protein